LTQFVKVLPTKAELWFLSLASSGQAVTGN
jgi:hypothetical protein